MAESKKSVGPIVAAIDEQTAAQKQREHEVFEQAVAQRPTGAITSLSGEEKAEAMSGLMDQAEHNVAQRAHAKMRKVMAANLSGAVADSNAKRITMKQAEEGDQ